ncbi:MAG: glycosyltransferase [Thermoanaerobaculia bacterium]
MTAPKRTVLVYRDQLLAVSESFIANQARALQRYAPVLVGTRMIGSDATRGFDTVSLAPPGSRDLAGEIGLKILGRPRRDWLRKLEVFAPSLLHAHFGTDGLFATPVARQLGIPLVVTFHGFDITIRPGASAAHFVYSKLRPQVFRNATRIIAVSSFVRERLIATGAPAEKIVVHYMGVDTRRFLSDPAIVREPVVLFVGRLVEKKGCVHLMQAMERLRAAGVRARTVIIGDGPLRQSLESMARSSNFECEFLGAQPPQDVIAWMNRASVFCVPSVTAETGDSEGLPTVYVEAQSMGLPCIGTRHNGIPEAVVDGATGLLVPERDVPALADSIARLLSDRDLWSSMSQRARAHAVRSFDVADQTVKLEAIYDDSAGVR